MARKLEEQMEALHLRTTLNGQRLDLGSKFREARHARLPARCARVLSVNCSYFADMPMPEYYRSNRAAFYLSYVGHH